MNPLQLEEKLTELLKKAIQTNTLHPNCRPLYHLQQEDIEFAEKELDKPGKDIDTRLDTLIKLFIAFYIDAIPPQIIDNLKQSGDLYRKDESCRQFLLTIAGMLHEAKTIVSEDTDAISPYLIAYKDYLGDINEEEIPESDIDEYFVSKIDSTIQCVINY